MFTMQFHVNKCKEEVGLLQSCGDSASESENPTEVKNGNDASNNRSDNVQNNSTKGHNEADKDIQEELDKEGIELWLRKLKNDNLLRGLIPKLYEAK